jgi:hypothetical protein
MGSRQLVTEMNEERRAITGEPADGSDVGAVLAIARRHINYPHLCFANCLGNCDNQRLQLLGPIQ